MDAPNGQFCVRCDEQEGEAIPATQLWDRGEDFAFWTRQPRRIPVCAACWRWFDNWEPPDREGEPPLSLHEQGERAWRQKHGLR